MPDNEFYDSDEGEAQGAGGNLKSKHERDYKDDVVESTEDVAMDITMSQQEEEEIADALKDIVEDDNKETNEENAVNQTENVEAQQEDIVMTGIVFTTEYKD